MRLPDALIRCIPVVGELFDVVNQAEELPLTIDLGSPAQREPVQSLVVPYVRKDRLDGREALRVLRASRGRINLCFHASRVRLRLFRCALRAPAEERDLSGGGLLGRPQTLRAECAGHTIPFRAAKLLRHEAVGDEVLSLAVQRLPGRTDTRARLRIIRESLG